MEYELLTIKNNAISLILDAKERKELEEIKLQFLGRSGELTQALKGLKNLSVDDKPKVGKIANEVKNIIEDAIKQKQTELVHPKKATQKIDTSEPGITPEIGHLHPMTLTLFEMVEIFKKIGFQAADGPDIETDHYNFEILNIPKNHPARDTQQSLYLDTRNSKTNPGEILLRTHGSNMQGRIMEKTKPPIRAIYPGKAFRYEQVDASHGFEFWQLEGLAIGTDITMTNLFGTMSYIVKEFFGKDTKVKFVCHNFPFVEPGAEAYMSCTVCKGKGCSFCKHSGWVEILGCGMIHPKVLKAVGYDSQKYSGFAWGMGLSRMVTLRYMMDDLRLLTNPDMRILEQF
ncbi:MAG TPA: phenylalanine--tRNA ligase subunit alpha [Candidatus Limnocylindrales bacterium]|nr:phenylalanine--tRNA ligase subunit alpha [Candidatus Limnocylindrales bacterium]